MLLSMLFLTSYFTIKFHTLIKCLLMFARCCLGKAHRLPSHPSSTSYTFPLELIFTDLWGLALVVLSQGLGTILPLLMHFLILLGCIFSNKFEAFHAFLQFKVFVELQLGYRIKSVQSDWGLSFVHLPNFFKNIALHIVLFVLTHIIKMAI